MTNKSDYINIHTHTRSNESHVVSLVCVPPLSKISGFCCSGIHPWQAELPDSEKILEWLISAPLSAVGEIGLDYSVGVDRGIQHDLFEKQLAIAQMRSLPVVIHCVRAYNDAIAILKDYRLPGVIFHGYTGSPEQAQQIAGHGYYLSFGPRTLRSPKTILSLEIISAHAIFAETDDSGTDIKEVYRMISGIKNIKVEMLRETMAENFSKIFHE